jgi:hypothetical protein
VLLEVLVQESELAYESEVEVTPWVMRLHCLNGLHLRETLAPHQPSDAHRNRPRPASPAVDEDSGSRLLLGCCLDIVYHFVYGMNEVKLYPVSHFEVQVLEALGELVLNLVADQVYDVRDPLCLQKRQVSRRFNILSQ